VNGRFRARSEFQRSGSSQGNPEPILWMMGNPTNAVCFTCGLAIEAPPRLTRLTNGQVCPACRERVLEGLPPALPSRSAAAAARPVLEHGAGEPDEPWDGAS
jgi:hypothetical protein